MEICNYLNYSCQVIAYECAPTMIKILLFGNKSNCEGSTDLFVGHAKRKGQNTPRKYVIAERICFERQ